MKRLRSRRGAPGIIEVAQRAGVSPATVSRAYNTPDLVKPDTRKRIEKAAADLGYIRDLLAGSLQNRFSGTFGLVVPTIDNAIFAELIESFAARLRHHDRTMLVAAHGYDLQLEVAIVRSLLERRIDGVALIGFDHNQIPLAMLRDRAVPTLSIWNYRDASPLPCVGADNFEAGRLVAEHLLAMGHRDPVLLFPPTEANDRARDRLAGAMAAIKAYGIDLPPERLRVAPYDLGRAKAIMLDLCEADLPSAVICGNDIIAQGVIYACQAAQLAIPGDLSVVGIGDFRGSAHIEPGLTTVRLPAQRIGLTAADILVEMSQSRADPEPWQKLVDITFVERGSTGPPTMGSG
ncbi:MAG: LacI family DNA-binding transcriptional regulator [Pseudomonadota bacterium]